MAGAYENPQRITGDTYASAFSRGDKANESMLQPAQQSTQANEQESKKSSGQKQEADEQRRIIENMQRVQSNADIWNLEQMKQTCYSS